MSVVSNYSIDEGENSIVGIQGESILTITSTQEKEFWKYVRFQMLWNFIIGLLLGIYELLVGGIGVFVLDFFDL